MAQSSSFGGVEAPTKYWEKRVLCAYLRMMGATQKDAGHAIGRTTRTVQDWEADKETWHLAREEARQRWLGELTDAARGALLRTIRGGDGDLSLRVLERIDVDLAPPKQKMEHTGKDGHSLPPLQIILTQAAS